ncbi:MULTISPECIES: protoporphyrinogen oxidase [Paenibacillus]|uniref:protoporphyrinogen oxidase n=1 Tax=Paenibacillus TaxID=44249 RepID=UPI0003D37C9F|nr:MULTISPECIES: protoporphyrinogen oxidase [Paenibacillus]AIW41029.1 protoporphyrinogen oxidase [Paenibacillus polymyxa CR1]OMF34893.1 protoporphyrinogen oxidase [Paenibacillus peoriae]
MKKSSKKVVILGGGISGLSAAFYVKKLAEDRQLEVEITLVEKSERLGGKLQTVRQNDFMIEKGPDAFLARKTAILDLTMELGLEAELVSTNPKAKSACILHKGKLHTMPMGFILGIPTKLTPFIRTGLISPLGKARAALDLFIPAKKGDADESLGDFIKRRLGKEVLDQITEPLLSGIYAGDTHSLSLMSTFPQFKLMEQKHGSLIKGMSKGAGRKPAVQDKLPDIAKKSMFLSYRLGLSTIVERLKERLDTVRFVMGQGVVEVRKENGYQVILEHGQKIDADAVICAVPAFEAAALFSGVASASWLHKIHYVSVANIALAYKNTDLNFAFEGTGFLVPRKEGKKITACTWSSTKWSHTAPEGYTLLRTYIGHAGAQEWIQMTDDQLVDAARKDLKDLMGLEAEPEFVEVSRCDRSMPQYPIGHKEHMAKMRQDFAQYLPGVFLCGAGYGGVGIPDCIAQGKEAAEQLLSDLL